MSTTASTSSEEEAPIKYVCGIDIGSQACAGCICRPDKSMVVKPMTFANAREGWQLLLEKLAHVLATCAIRWANWKFPSSVIWCFDDEMEVESSLGGTSLPSWAATH